MGWGSNPQCQFRRGSNPLPSGTNPPAIHFVTAHPHPWAATGLEEGLGIFIDHQSSRSSATIAAELHVKVVQVGLHIEVLIEKLSATALRPKLLVQTPSVELHVKVQEKLATIRKSMASSRRGAGFQSLSAHISPPTAISNLRWWRLSSIASPAASATTSASAHHSLA